MHEFSTTQQIVSCILKEAKKRRAKKVIEVNLAIGKLTVLGLEQIRFCYELLVKDTLMENSKLRIEQVEPVVECEKCNYNGPIRQDDNEVYHFIFPVLKCPECGGTVSIVKGRECLVKNFIMVT